MNTLISIEEKFCGPPQSGNGGYTCGLLAQHIGNPAEVTLMIPPPLCKPLTIKTSEGKTFLMDGEAIVASGTPSVDDIPVSEPPTLEQVLRAEMLPDLIQNNPFPTCFVCGSGRAEGDGLRLFPGRVNAKDCVAATWVPDASLSDSQGFVRDEIIWSALDCPGAWAAWAERMRVIVLGRLAVEIIEKARCNERHIVMGWQSSENGRKIEVGTALLTESGRVLAKAKATWIELKQKD